MVFMFFMFVLKTDILNFDRLTQALKQGIESRTSVQASQKKKYWNIGFAWTRGALFSSAVCIIRNRSQATESILTRFAASGILTPR